VRVEGRDDRGAAGGTRTLDRAANHRLVPQVKSIEIAERDIAPAKALGHRRAAGKPLHGVGL